jgi:hypothetical protein
MCIAPQSAGVDPNAEPLLLPEAPTGSNYESAPMVIGPPPVTHSPRADLELIASPNEVYNYAIAYLLRVLCYVPTGLQRVLTARYRPRGLTPAMTRPASAILSMERMAMLSSMLRASAWWMRHWSCRCCCFFIFLYLHPSP